MLQDILQAYTQSKTKLNCTVIRHLLIKLKKKYSKGIILFVVKLLYNQTEAGNHWFTIYLDYHKEKLGIKISFYDICLLITQKSNKNFDIARFQINNTFNIKMEAFIYKKKTKIIKAMFKAKTQTILKTGISRDFDNYCITIKAKSIMI